MFNNIQDPRIAQGFQSLVRAFGGSGSAADIIQADLDRRRGALIDAQVLTEGGQLAAAQALAQNRLAQAGLYGAQTGEVTQRTDALGSLPGILGGETVDQAALAAALLMGGLDINQGPGAAAMAVGGNPYGNAQNFSDVLAATGVMSDYANTPAGTAAELEAANAIAAATDATNRYNIDRTTEATRYGDELDLEGVLDSNARVENAAIYGHNRDFDAAVRGHELSYAGVLDANERASADRRYATDAEQLVADLVARLTSADNRYATDVSSEDLRFQVGVESGDRRYASDQERAADEEAARLQYRDPQGRPLQGGVDPVASGRLFDALMFELGLDPESDYARQWSPLRVALDYLYRTNGQNAQAAIQSLLAQVPTSNASIAGTGFLGMGRDTPTLPNMNDPAVVDLIARAMAGTVGAFPTGTTTTGTTGTTAPPLPPGFVPVQ